MAAELDPLWGKFGIPSGQVRHGSSEYKLTKNMKNEPENVVLNCPSFRLALWADLFFELLLGLPNPLMPNKMYHLYQTDEPVLN